MSSASVIHKNTIRIPFYMISLECERCKGLCCHHPRLTPILTPSEAVGLEYYADRIVTPQGNIHSIRKNSKGECVFYDRKQSRCKDYDARPLECRIYPFLLDFTKEEADIRLDHRFCRYLDSLEFDRSALIKLVRSYDFPKDWILSYNHLVDF